MQEQLGRRAGRAQDQIINQPRGPNLSGHERDTACRHALHHLEPGRFHHRGVFHADLRLRREHLAHLLADLVGVGLAGMDKLFGAFQAPAEGQRGLPVFGTQERVPRAFRHAVRFAHNRADDQSNIQVQVLDHATDHQRLLEVLLSEISRFRPDDVEELQDDRRRAAKMARAKRSLQRRGGLPRLHETLESIRIHLARAGRKHGIHHEGLKQRHVRFQIARVAVEVLGGAELGRVDKNGDDDHIALAFGLADQTQVTVVQTSHRRDQCHGLPVRVHLPEEAFDLRDGGDEPHHPWFKTPGTGPDGPSPRGRSSNPETRTHRAQADEPPSSP